MKHRQIGIAQRGVGLIEVLISLLVLSIGMLGLASLQMFSLRNNQGAMERSMAVVETHSIVDAMRADRANALAGMFNTGGEPNASAGTSFAVQSLARWQASLQRTLGTNAQGTVECTGGGVCTIRVTWTDARSVDVNARSRESSAARQVETVVHL